MSFWSRALSFSVAPDGNNIKEDDSASDQDGTELPLFWFTRALLYCLRRYYPLRRRRNSKHALASRSTRPLWRLCAAQTSTLLTLLPPIADPRTVRSRRLMARCEHTTSHSLVTAPARGRAKKVPTLFASPHWAHRASRAISLVSIHGRSSTGTLYCEATAWEPAHVKSSASANKSPRYISNISRFRPQIVRALANRKKSKKMLSLARATFVPAWWAEVPLVGRRSLAPRGSSWTPV